MTGRQAVAIWAALIALALPAASQAAFPGQNGRIAFTGIDRLTGRPTFTPRSPAGTGWPG